MSYNADSIRHLDTREAMREKIPMYLGSADLEGMYQALKEIINNSTDEALAGYGNKIDIQINENSGYVSITDEGRGIPFSCENGHNTLVAIFTEAHTGGKFDKNSYKNSSGLNGIGGTAVCMSSYEFTVQSRRDGTAATAKFKQGILMEYKEEPTTLPTGTTITFKPDSEVFINTTENFSFDRICDEIKNIAYLNKGIHFNITAVDDNNKEIKKKEFYSEHGIADFIVDIAKKPLMKKPIICSATDGIDEVEVAFLWTGGTENSYVFANGLYCCSGGSPITAAKRTFTNSIKKISNQSFSPESIRRGLVYAINCKVREPSFSNQTKNNILNPSLGTLTTKALKEGLEEFSRIPECSNIIEMMSRFEKAEKAADRARENALKQDSEISKELRKKTVLAGKLADCRYHDEKSQLIVVEGLSALGGIVKSRNSDYTAAFPLTGKILNVLKSTEDEQFSNEVLKNLHTAIGAGFNHNFNMKKMRYGRIVFVCDADEDGYSIMCLLLAFMYKYYPELLRQKKIFWGQTPLFKVTTKQNKIYYAYTEKELESLPDGDILRAKGIGELEPEDFKNTLFSEKGRYIPFSFEDAEKANYYFDVLLGENIEERKKYISKNADFDALD